MRSSRDGLRDRSALIIKIRLQKSSHIKVRGHVRARNVLLHLMVYSHIQRGFVCVCLQVHSTSHPVILCT